MKHADAMPADEREARAMIAKHRGERLRIICTSVLDDLIAEGVLDAGRRDDACVVMFSRLADQLYGNAPIDIPPLRRDPAPMPHPIER